MKTFKCVPLMIGFLVLSACAPVNTQFSCNETAGDRCLSIEEVNAMTEMHEQRQGALQRSKGDQPRYRPHSKTQTIWVAPWKDAQGNLHQNDTLFASIDVQDGTA